LYKEIKHVRLRRGLAGNDIEDITLYAAAIFTLKHRGYETHTEDGVIFVTDEDGDVVHEESYRSE
jgi:hypothetical protein